MCRAKVSKRHDDFVRRQSVKFLQKKKRNNLTENYTYYVSIKAPPAAKKKKTALHIDYGLKGADKEAKPDTEIAAWRSI